MKSNASGAHHRNNLQALAKDLDGDLRYDDLHRILYATDASIYRELPLAVAYPMYDTDILTLVHFARQHSISLIPRTAGTSLAGQCVGTGIVVDVSRYMNKILEINTQEQWALVQPGVIRDELNQFLEPKGLFFGPNTSTANRCMLGGMVGNNSSGTTSIKYGVTRDKVIELEVILSDGSKVAFTPLSSEEFEQKKSLGTLEGQLYRQISAELSDPTTRKNILDHFPKGSLHRRNTGYAVDMLLRTAPFHESGPEFNFCKLLTGSEGTLALTTAIKLKLDLLPPPAEVLVCAHFSSLNESLRAAVVAMRHQPFACELMDKSVMDCTRDNRQQQKNRFFLQGAPAAILILELRGQSRQEAEHHADMLIANLRESGLGYAFPKVFSPDTKRVWSLRAAGFGVLSNVKTPEKPLEFVEDTAVDLPDLPAYIEEFEQMLADFGQKAVYYAHAGAGELHVRPSLNLKSEAGVRLLRQIAEASARLVKKYNGSLSGEHGDGRVRAEFIPLVLGQENYELFRRIKQTWDHAGIFNPGKIVDAPPMDTSLRYALDTPKRELKTIFNFSETGGILRLAEKCSGSGDCRKLPEVSGGLMCPSYMATRAEKDSTRARANALREILTRSVKPNPFDHAELREVMDLCLSCKGCASECPSSVDVATMKAEFLHQYYRANGVPLRAKVFGNIATLNRWASLAPRISNFFFGNQQTSSLLKKALGISQERSLPLLSGFSFRKWHQRHRKNLKIKGLPKGKVYLFCDEFTNYNEAMLGVKTVRLLLALGYEVDMPPHADSGRAQVSKGLLIDAQRLAKQNVATFRHLVTAETPLLGIEPSAILSFRDEYPRLVDPSDADEARKLGENCLMIEEFFAREMRASRIGAEHFSKAEKKILLHGHCHQKALASVTTTVEMLSLPENYYVEVIPSGCCGMAGSFGYETEHYQVSMKVGELVLFPAIRQAQTDCLISAPGTSCRHQIADGTGRQALHPVEILWEALSENLKT